MDYRGFREGVTVYFPVWAEGGLFFLGDGHALQGDGEIAGTGLEISMDVQFSVDLIKGQHIRWPRGEDREYIFTVGNARPLDQCVQHTTSEILRWLTTQYGLDIQGPRNCWASACAMIWATSSTLSVLRPLLRTRETNRAFGSGTVQRPLQ